MKTIYIDSEFKCHAANADDRQEFDTAFFDGKCSAFIEGYRYVPSGSQWTRTDGVVFTGEMITPWKPYSELAAAQAQYEATLAEMNAAYQEGVASA